MSKKKIKDKCSQKYTLKDILPDKPIKQKEIDWGKAKGKEVW